MCLWAVGNRVCVCVLCGYGNAHSNPVLGETVLGCWRTKKKTTYKTKEQTDKVIFQRSIPCFFFFVAHFCSKARANQCAKEEFTGGAAGKQVLISSMLMRIHQLADISMKN